ncbi:NADH-ubiquinone oxidoreductase-F iron-sulfur binding region domain-containing protein [Acidothermaceae bacterium B102]|nr:NADH-ubiquinone oxidoreductase-F iron-sulfur binding region domain-containing protein [Acidothermaceae bacterium B102]
MNAAAILDDVTDSGLLGRGGAGFPTGRKMRTVAAGTGRAVVVGNGCEGEPGSSKDTMLMLQSPHLVLDGLALAARAVGSREIHLVLHEGSRVKSVLTEAIADRKRHKIDATRVHLHAVPARYVASEESALVQFLNGGPAKPMFTPPRPFERGVGGRPTLINNVETLAHVALITRYGPGWYRSVGDVDEPGTMLLTVAGPRAEPAVLETRTGTTVDAVLGAAGVRLDDCQAVLVGGYFGTWLAPTTAHRLPLTHASMRAVGGALGAGIIMGLPRGNCGLTETARVATYLAAHNAGQCGPCFNGLPAIATALQRLAYGPWDERMAAPLSRWLSVVPGRGACRHPDGAIRLVASALQLFSSDVDAHRSGFRCRHVGAQPFLPIPDLAAASGAWR